MKQKKIYWNFRKSRISSIFNATNRMPIRFKVVALGNVRWIVIYTIYIIRITIELCCWPPWSLTAKLRESCPALASASKIPAATAEKPLLFVGFAPCLSQVVIVFNLSPTKRLPPRWVMSATHSSSEGMCHPSGQTF